MLRATSIVAAIVSGIVASCIVASVSASPPKCHDERVQIRLFAEDPAIRTPIGLAVDDKDRIFVLESHTHTPPSHYSGPKHDRIKIFSDRDGDGQADSATVFADRLSQGMNIAFSPSGDLYVVCARAVVQLRDLDQDGRCDEKRQILTLETSERYPHNCLLSLAFDDAGWLYVGRGNTAGKEHRLVGSDGSEVAGYGDGGNVVRCRADGSELQEFATGFWNPFAIRFDCDGRLLLVDNDPDARGPNRLVHVVPGGDYGYKSLYGGGGNHPFQGWDGKLPGTLPMISGTGEAPSGVIDCRQTSLPQGDQHSVLVTVWNENTIERIQLIPSGASLNGERSVFVEGDTDFRPVAIDSDSRGNLFVSDWVLVDYPNHGRGRIWRISPAKQNQTGPDCEAAGESGAEAPGTILVANAEPELWEAAGSPDPFVSHTAVMRLSKPEFSGLVRRMARDGDAGRRMTALLAMKRARRVEKDALQDFLTDPDLRVRYAALLWIGDHRLTEFREQLDRVLADGRLDGPTFAAYLAAVECLDPAFVEAYESRAEDSAKNLKREGAQAVLRDVASNEQLPGEVRAFAIARMDDSVAKSSATQLQDLATPDTPRPIRLAVIRRLGRLWGSSGKPNLEEWLLRIALDEQGSEVRCEALLSLSFRNLEEPARLLPLLSAADRDVAYEAARTLRQATAFEAEARDGISERLEELAATMDLSVEVQELVESILTPNQSASVAKSRPQSDQAWHQALMSGGDASRGERVFHSPTSACTKCHTIDQMGGTLGPDLSQLASSVDRGAIIKSILDPSASYAPQYQAWGVITTEGKLCTGLQLDHKSGGAIEMILDSGEKRRFRAEEIASYDAMPRSLMPDGLEATMTVREFRDLIAFLSSLR